MRRAAGLVFSVLLFSVLTFSVTSCGTENPTPPAAPTPSASLTPSVPVMPEAAKGTSRAAAKEFVRYYVAVMSYAAQTLDTKPLRAASAKSCTSCLSIIASLAEIKASGGSFASDPMTVSSVLLRSTGPDGSLSLVAHVRVPKQMLIPSAGASPQVTSGDSDSVHLFTLKHNASGWRVTRLDIR